MRLGTQELSSSGTIERCVKNMLIAKRLESVFEDHLWKFAFAVGISSGTYLGAALTQVETDVREGWDRLGQQPERCGLWTVDAHRWLERGCDRVHCRARSGCGIGWRLRFGPSV